MTELLLMFASRTQAAAEIIIPALQRGDIVVSDRFTDSSLAYQGHARGLGMDVVLEAHRLAVGSLLPDITLCTMVDVETGLARAHHRNRHASEDARETRLDHQSLEFHKRVKEAYEKIAAREPQRFRIIDASGDPGTVSKKIWSEIEPLLVRSQ